MNGPETRPGATPEWAEAAQDAEAWVGSERQTQPQSTRTFLIGVSSFCAAAAVLIASSGRPLAGGFAAVLALMTLVAAASLRLPVPWRVHALTVLLMLLVLTVSAAAQMLDSGLAGPALAVGALLVCVLTATAGWRAGVRLAGVSLAAQLWMAWGATRPDAALPQPSLHLMLGGHLLLLLGGLVAGLSIDRLVGRSVRTARRRVERFRSLLALAADGYWETDTQHRLQSASHQQPGGTLTRLDELLGAVPWELPGFDCAPEWLDWLRAELDAHQAFRDLPVTWTSAQGRRLHLRVSGSPRRDARGVYIGYWGLVRDVTEVQALRAAQARTEALYEELFQRIPTPVILHGEGRLLEANPAARRLFGWEPSPAALPAEPLSLFQTAAERDAVDAAMTQLLLQPSGTALPATDHRVVVGTQVLSLRVSTVVVTTPSGKALLSLVFDETERLAAREVVRRSESLIRHIVETSPDVISLSEADSGHFVMVNKAFEWHFGWSAAEALGRSSMDLGMWTAQQRDAVMVAPLRQRVHVRNQRVDFRARDGQIKPMMLSAAWMEVDGRSYVVVNSRDVSDSERSRLEREAILEGASIGIAVTRGGRFAMANPQVEKMHGWPRGALLGRSWQVLLPPDFEQSEQAAALRAAQERAEPMDWETETLRRDGSRLTVHISGRAIDPSRPVDGGTVWIVEDVTERRRFEHTLARARDEAEAANRAKSAFLANTSHELRTPLNGMIGLARLAADPELPEPRRREYLGHIASSAQALTGVISDILDLSKIEAGKLRLEHRPFDLGEMLQSLRQFYAALAASRGLALTLDLQAGLLGLVRGDPLRLRQILGNFLDNALKFTVSGDVHLRAWRRDDDGRECVRFEVQDSGPGIDSALVARLFSPFTQADESTTRRYGGSGLGLSICRELAGLMGGEVGVDSEPGQGSCFWAELPLPPLAAAAGASATPAPSPVAADALQGLRVLLVEDNAVNMLIGVALLERWGVTVTQACDGVEALEIFEATMADGDRFDGVLMDVQMPRMGGHEATRVLRAHAGGRDLPIIALTAAALTSEREQALAAGMTDFLTKPIDADSLQAALVRWCRR